MKHIIIGTAGHVDHGKTALIKALTGIDTDRLKEEKTRGISIDLGFASLMLNENIAAGIVDVPGHERFLKNMLAGTGGIDLVILVIAADEGVMPQTKEHLAMLQLYGVRKGVVVLTKIDKVDEQWLELVEEDVKKILEETFLSDAPLCKVSSTTKKGVEQLKELLLEVTKTIAPRDSEAPFRLWIDRVFTVKGYGAVVTGSVLSGKVRTGEHLRIDPDGSMLRVRGLEWHSHKVDQINAGQRAAINLGGTEMPTLNRGMVLSSPSRGLVSTRWDILVNWHQEVASSTRVRFHIGTGEFLGRLYKFKNQPLETMRLILETPLSGGLGDKGIIRQYSPQHLLGGATLLAPSKLSRKLKESRRNLAKAITAEDMSETIYEIISDSDQPLLKEDINRNVGYINSEIVDQLLKQLTVNNRIILLGPLYWTSIQLGGLTEQFTAMLAAYHYGNPDRAGMSKEVIRQKLHIPEKVIEELLGHWKNEERIVLAGGEVALKQFAEEHSNWRLDLISQAEIVLVDNGLVDVDVNFLAQKLGVSVEKARTSQEILIKEGILIEIGEIHVYRKTIQNIVAVIQVHFKESATLTVGQLRDLIGTSRKLAVPLLEYFDVHKYTVRQGDVRRPGAKIGYLSE